MYNQVSRGPNFGPGGSHPPPPPPPAQHAYQQQAHPPPPPHFQQGHHAYLHGPPNASSTGTASLSFQAPHGVASSGKYGNTMAQQNFTSHGQNLQHSSNSGGVQSLHAHLPVPPPPVGHSQQEMSWPPGPPSRILLPPPPPTSSQGQVLYKPPFLLPPPQPGGSQNVQHSHNTLPPPPPLPGSGFLANAPDGGYLHSNAGNYQVPAVTASLQPPLPPCPPPLSPSPPPPAPPVTSAFSNAVHCHPKSSKVSGSELKALDLVDKSGDYYPSGVAPVNNSDPNQNSGSLREVASSDRDEQLLSTRDENKNEPQSRPQAMDFAEPWYQLHVTTESADSDMEMEDDITLSDKDQGPNYAIDTQNQLHPRVGEEFSIDEIVHQLQNSKENDPANNIISIGSVAKDNSPVNNSSEMTPQGTVLEKYAAPENVASDLIEETNPDRNSGKIIRSGSPIRLLQDYASDDTSDNEETCGTGVNILTISAGAAAGVLVDHKDSGSYLENDIGSKKSSCTLKEFEQFSEISPLLEPESRQCIEVNHANQVSVAASVEAFQGKEALGGTSIESGSKSGNAEQEYLRKGSKFEANVLKVDEFGRQPKEAPTESDSESDDSHYHRTQRVSKRGRSRSRSPLDRSRNHRRKSPRRRKSKRSRSRSWSPRHRRSRSRSPTLKRTGDFGGENMRRDRGQCFNFLRGKCFRGASCRYIHHESDKNASSRHSRNKHDQEVDTCAKYSRIKKSMKNISPEVSDLECDGIRNQDVDHYQSVTQVDKRKEVSVRHAVVSTASDFESQSVRNDPLKSESFREVAPKMQKTILPREELNNSIHENDSLQKAANVHQKQVVDCICPDASDNGDTFKPSSGTYEGMISPEDNSFVHQFQPNVTVGVSEHSGNVSQHKNASIASDLSSDKISMVSVGANKASGCEPSPLMLPSTQPLSTTSSIGPWLSSEQPSLLSQASKEFTQQHNSAAQLPVNAYQLPPPPVVSYAQNENAMHLPQSLRDYGVRQESASFPFQSTTREKIEPRPAPLHMQNPQFGVPPHYVWASLPLPPPPPPSSQAVYNSGLNSGVTKSYVSSEFNQSQLHSRADFVSQTSDKPVMPSHSGNPEFQTHAYPTIPDCSLSFVPMEAFSPDHLPQGNPANQLLSGRNSREDLYKQFPLQDPTFSSSAGLHPQQQYSWQSDASRQQPSFGGKLLPEDHFKQSSHIHPSAQKQQPMYNFQYSASEGNLSVPGETGTISRYPADVLDSNHSTSLPAFGGSRISAHYNPYASTFEQPLSSKFSSSIFRQENEIIHGNSYGSYRLNPSISREGIDGIGSRQLVSSPKPAKVVGQNPRSSDKQYDPLFDSIEPTSSSPKKLDFEPKQEVTGESNISLRPKSHYMPLDVEEENKKEEVGAVASTTSQHNDEYGETEDAEVGDVENESLSNHLDIANMSPGGEVEINQIKSPGKRKKGKDSRSMKLFKVSIANFVKEVLKPSWRQGNMSKVAFKTIVKKTVDKVSGAMKGHHIPKSQAKISQYIDSSQRKLTKLVMGYVDKYVKV